MHLTSCAAQEKETHQGPACNGHNDTMVTATKEGIRDKNNNRRKTSMTCLPLRDLCDDFFRHLFSHGSRATSAAATSLQSPEDERRRVHHEESTSGEAASATACTSTNYFKNFNIFFNEQPLTSATSTRSTTLRPLATTTATDINKITDSHLYRQYISTQSQQQAWPQQKVQAHRT